MKSLKALILFSVLLSFSANALLEVNIIKSKEDAFPLVIVPLKVIGDVQWEGDITRIIRDDLYKSGHFNVVFSNDVDFDFFKENKKDAVVFGTIAQPPGSQTFNVGLYVYGVYSQKKLYEKHISLTNASIRKVAHILSDKIYEVLLGQKGAFNTKLTYVTVTNNENGDPTYRLVISDYDGHNPQVLDNSLAPILSPTWSSDLKKLAYVSFKNNRSEVFIKYPFWGMKDEKLPRFDGIASSPSWHPDGERIALTISKNGNKDIYLYNLKTKENKRLTTNSAIDTEANFSPDGKSIAFTSNRTGQVQIYIKNLETGKISRATFQGRYNAKPVFSPDGKDLALVHRVGQDYRIALLNIATRDLTVMTQNKSDESPYFSPNGGMIIFATNRDNEGILSIISLHNNQIVELTQKDSFIREPSWSNYLRK
jgi:TolB protein